MDTKLMHNILTSMNYSEKLNNCIPFLIYIYSNIYRQLIYNLD